MGIQGLLPLLSSIQKHSHLRDFAGQRLGIDAYGWLHRGTFTCAIELAQGKVSRGYIDFALSRIRMLKFFGVIPYLVFDGGRLPSKALTEQGRSERRKEGRRLGLEHLRNGKSTQAYQELQKSIDVTPQMARNLIEELKAAGVDYVVAPYEADSQLAYLERRGDIAGILSEDSDLLVFGAKVLITKLDQHGECVVFRREDFAKCREISLVNWSESDFRMMTILSGCDYLPCIPGIGLKSAYRLVRQHKSIEKIVRILQFDGKKKVPANYLQSFYDAERTFLYQWVFCPAARRTIHLNTPPKSLTAAHMPYIGQELEPEHAVGVAKGDLDPSTKRPLKSDLVPALRKTQSFSHGATRRAPLVRANTAQTPEVKPGRPISDFFKPARTPLAELDPNAFTPSPSQQRLLNSQQGRSWSARQTPSGPSEDAAIRAAMQTTPRAASNLKNPSGRVRLCSTTTESAAIVSPYFAAPKQKAKANDAFELFSDDSICDALQSSADAAEQEYEASQQRQSQQAGSQPSQTAPQSSDAKATPRKRKRFEVLRDNADKRRSFSTTSASTLERSRPSTLLSEETVHTAETAASTASPPCTPDVQSDFQKLSKEWLYDLKVPTKWPFAGSAQSGVATSMQQPASSEIQQKEDNTIPFSSPLQVADEPEIVDLTDVGVESLLRQGRIKLRGSEDQLVPQSPGAGDDDGRLRLKVGLGRFTFSHCIE